MVREGDIDGLQLIVVCLLDNGSESCDDDRLPHPRRYNVELSLVLSELECCSNSNCELIVVCLLIHVCHVETGNVLPLGNLFPDLFGPIEIMQQLHEFILDCAMRLEYPVMFCSLASFLCLSLSLLFVGKQSLERIRELLHVHATVVIFVNGVMIH